MVRSTILAALALAVGLAGCTRNQRTDTAITTDVKQVLAKEQLPPTISVTTNDGVVTLAGAVTDPTTKQHAGAVAGDVRGVRQVVNNLRTTMAGDAPIQWPNAPPNAPALMPNVPQNPPSGMPANPPPAQAPNEAPNSD